MLPSGLNRVRPTSALVALLLTAAACSSATGLEATGSDTDGTPPSAVSAEVGADQEVFRPYENQDPFDLSGGAPVGDDTALSPSSVEDLSDFVRSVVGIWDTDWNRATVDLGEVAAGIQRIDPRDAIPPIDEPAFESVAAGAEWLSADEPGALVQLDDEVRFYPLSIMTRHEIVNDRFGDIPVAVTFCPLCNTALAFDRRVDSEVLRFGVSGLLRKSDLVMWDDKTTSLWQQITGEAIVGRYAGTQLNRLDTSIVSFGQFAESFPDGRVLSRDTGFEIGYGANPYVGYSSGSRPFAAFFPDEPDSRFPALERVVSVSVGETERAYPFSILYGELVINDIANGQPIVVWWAPGTTDALDARSIADSQAIGTGLALGREVDGRELTFTANGDGTFMDNETLSLWNLFGKATAGELEGSQLPAIPHRNEFWFAWAGFFPDGEVYQP
ncbi:MAG: DUF3179 domain-containing protein [Acidimicrobiales bacterium]|nr:DUF3179 domain-containing protein [Acidimicrobiales bacterium]